MYVQLLTVVVTEKSIQNNTSWLKLLNVTFPEWFSLEFSNVKLSGGVEEL